MAISQTLAVLTTTSLAASEISACMRGGNLEGVVSAQIAVWVSSRSLIRH